MNKLSFTKLVASGNDFVLLDLISPKKHLNLTNIVRCLCSRKFGIGADGLLVLEGSKKADVRMRVFNPDGSEAEMCGNGARCVAYFVAQKREKLNTCISLDTKAGIINAQVDKDNIKINLTNPTSIKLDAKIKINKHPLSVNSINTGVPHIVILCEDIEHIAVDALGRLIRYHKNFSPKGTNVNFIEPKGSSNIKIRTYERGVETETLACGTGSVASAIIYTLKLRKAGLIDKDKISVNVDTASGETLKVYFDILKNKVKNVCLEGKARIICNGVCYV